MTCKSCGEPNKKCSCKNGATKAVIEIDNPETLVLLRKVVIPASMGDETTVPPEVGKYYNVVLEYEVNGHIYLYSSDGIPTYLRSTEGGGPNVVQTTGSSAIDVMSQKAVTDALPNKFSNNEWASLWT